MFLIKLAGEQLIFGLMFFFLNFNENIKIRFLYDKNDFDRTQQKKQG